MDYQTSSVSLSQKLSTGHSIYDGVFSAPSKFTVPSFSYRLEDYREIFAGSGASIPVLEVPELNERKASVDVRSSQLDYSNVFGGFADSDFAAPYEELFAEKKKKRTKQTGRQAERVSPPKEEAKRSCSEENIDLGNEAAYESIDGVKKFSMSYNQSNHRSKSFAGVHSVPAYTCLIDETSPLRDTGGDGDKPVSMSSVAKERRMEGNFSAKAVREQSVGNAGKKASGGGGVKAEDNSNWKNSIDELFNSNKSGQGAHSPSKPPFSSQVSEVDKPVSSVANDVEQKFGGKHQMKGTGDQPAMDVSKQTSGGVDKVLKGSKWRSSGSIDKFFSSGAIAQETRPSDMPPFSSQLAADESKQTSGGVAKVLKDSKWRSSGSFDKLVYSGEIAQDSRPLDMPPFSSMHSDGKGEFEKPMASMYGVLNCDTFKGAESVSSPPYFDEEVDTNSVAAASVAALTKAIEEAQASIQLAKELMDRKNVGPQSRVKMSFDNIMKPKSRKVNKFADKANISKGTKTRELYDKVDVPARVSAGLEQATPVLRNTFTVSDLMVTGEEIRGKKIIDNASTFTKKKTHELQEVHVSVQREQVTVALADTEARGKGHGQEIEPTPADHRHEEVHVSVQREQVIVALADTEARGKVHGQEIEPTPADHRHEEVHVSVQREQATVALADMEARGKVHGQEIEPTPADHRHEEVHVSVQREQVTVALADMEARGKVHGQETEPTPADHRHEEADDSEAAEQFYEFADTSEPDSSEAAEQFYEFADSSEPDVPEATEEFYEFADSSENHDIVLENQEANNTRQMFGSIDDDKQEKKTDFEAFENPKQVGETSEEVEANDTSPMFQSTDEDEQEKKMDGKTSKAATAEAQRAAEADDTRQMFQSVDEDEKETKMDAEAFKNAEEVGKKLKAATAEQRELENIFNVVREVSEFEEIDPLSSSQECSNQEDNEKPQGASGEHEETVKLKTTHVKETCDNKQNGDDKRFESQELLETEHVEIKKKLVAQELVENEKIDVEACMLEMNEGKQTYTETEVNTDRSLSDEDNKEDFIETVNDFYDKDDFGRRIEDDRKSEENEKFQDTKPNEKILEEATCQECEYRQEESIELEAGGIQMQMDETTETEKGQATQADQMNLDCNFEAADNLNQQCVCEDLDSNQGSARDVDCNQDVKENVEFPINKEDGGVKEVAETLIQLEQNENQTELVGVENGMVDKETCESDCLTPGVQFPERPKQTEDVAEILSFDKNEISASESDTSFVQKQDDQLVGEPSVDYNVERQVEECKESGDINSDMMGAEGGVIQDRNKNGSKIRKRWFGTNEVSKTFIKLEEDGNQSESVEEEDVMEEKVICEIQGLASGVRLAEILKQMEDVIDIHSSDTNDTSVYGQKQEAKLAREPEVACNIQKQVEDFRDINKDMMGPEVAAVNPEENVKVTKSSHRRRWFDNEKDTKVAHAPIFGRKAGSVLLDNDADTSLCTKRDEENHHKVMTSQTTEVNEDSRHPKESGTIHCSLKEKEQENNANPEATLSKEDNLQEVEQESHETTRAKESETNFTSQKEVEGERENQQESEIANEFEISASSHKVVELEKEQLKAEKRRERERQKEKRKVAQVIREARERSFADVKERVAETRQKVMAEAQGRSGKTSVQANDTSLAEKASQEAKAKQKWERAAVERATAEARDRALEKALSEKVSAEAGKQGKKSVAEKYTGASTDGKQAKRSVSEKLFGFSRDNGLSRSLDLESKGSFSSSTSRSPNSSKQSDPSPVEQSTGTIVESAQRCKARLERNQRTAERAAKALAEKNNRDLLVQQEQAERNRLAEVLDAEVKRWSSGKERNLRALLSSLQYILGPDSGWQPVHLTDIVTAVAVKKAYRKAALFVHPDKLQQRGASIQQKYICEKVFDLLKDAWNRFSMDER